MPEYLSLKPVKVWHWDPTYLVEDLLTSLHKFIETSDTREEDYSLLLSFTQLSKLENIEVCWNTNEDDFTINPKDYLVIEVNKIICLTRTEFLQNYKEVGK